MPSLLCYSFLFHHSGCEPLFFTVQKNSIGPLLVLHCILWFTLCRLCGTIVSSQEAGWDTSERGGMRASERGGMCYHSNKLSHWQDCTILVVHTGCRQQMQPLSCEGCVAVLVAGVKETPPWLRQRGAASLDLGGWWWRRGVVEMMVMAALFCCNLCCPICCVIFLWSHLFEVQAIVQYVAHFLLVFSAMLIFGCTCYFWNNNLTLLFF